MNSARTQISRTVISAPTRAVIAKGYVHGFVLHHGVGRAHVDTEALLAVPGVRAVTEYDPHPDPRAEEEWRRGVADPQRLRAQYDTVISNYVLNTLEPKDRIAVVHELADVVRAAKPRSLKTNVHAPRGVHSALNDAIDVGGTVIVSVRSRDEVAKIKSGVPYLDGVMTRSGTFQKGFTDVELQQLLRLRFQSVARIRGGFPVLTSSLVYMARDPKVVVSSK